MKVKTMLAHNVITDMAALTLNDRSPPDNTHLHTFGHTQFKPFQWQIIQSLLKGKDNCAFMTTGYGKSLCYQYPAVLTGGLCIVICPLISLMEHQVKSLEVQNIKACFLGTAQDNNSTVMEGLHSGDYNLVYMTPEYLTGGGGFRMLPTLHKNRRICLVAVDEAHCMSILREGLRPAYKELTKLRKALPGVPILAVSAVATEAVKLDIIETLGLREPQVFCSEFDRPNLYFEVQKLTGNVELDKKSLMMLLNREDFDIRNNPVVIYCLSKKNAEKIVKVLLENKFSCDLYSADHTIDQRRTAQRRFLGGDVQIMVATIAFGMGIHIPNVRCVINYGTPTEMEVYYLEAGRAGHDGKPALCITYHCAAQNFVQRSNYNPAMKYYISTRGCRRHHILSYFEKERELSTTIQANCCDNCTKRLNAPDWNAYEELDDNGFYDFTEDTAMFLNAVEYLSSPVQVKTIVAFLRGTKEKSLERKHHDSVYFGSGKSRTKIWWLEVALILEEANYIERIKSANGKYPVVVFGQKGGVKWLEAYDHITNEPVLLPPTEEIVKNLTIKRRQ